MTNRVLVLMCVALSLSFAGCKKDQGAKAAAAGTAATKETPPADKTEKPATPKATPSAAGFDGTYKIDTDAMMGEAKAKIAQLPKEQQKMAGMMMGFIKMMNVTMTLAAGGSATFKMVMKNPFKPDAPAKERSETGTWKVVDGKVTIKATDEKSKKEKDIICEKKADHLVCSEQSPSAKRKPSLFFKKV